MRKYGMDMTRPLRKYTVPTLRPTIGPEVRISLALRKYETLHLKKTAAERLWDLENGTVDW
jgi:hypothetical protein